MCSKKLSELFSGFAATGVSACLPTHKHPQRRTSVLCSLGIQIVWSGNPTSSGWKVQEYEMYNFYIYICNIILIFNYL